MNQFAAAFICAVLLLGCVEITDEDVKDAIINSATNPHKTCEELSGVAQARCYADKAFSDGKIDSCDKIYVPLPYNVDGGDAEVSAISDLKENCYLNYAQRSGDANACKSTSAPANCITSVATSHNNILACWHIDDASAPTDAFGAKLDRKNCASKVRDAMLAFECSHESGKDLEVCAVSNALIARDPSRCDKYLLVSNSFESQFEVAKCHDRVAQYIDAGWLQLENVTVAGDAQPQ